MLEMFKTGTLHKSVPIQLPHQCIVSHPIAPMHM
ncbi:unnamed protein product, partial [Larinioides sclopetarius]